MDTIAIEIQKVNRTDLSVAAHGLKVAIVVGLGSIMLTTALTMPAIAPIFSARLPFSAKGENPYEECRAHAHDDKSGFAAGGRRGHGWGRCGGVLARS